MMKYRLVCIYDKDSIDKKVTIEVCMETGAKTLSPFQRKVKVSDLMRSEWNDVDGLVKILFQAGFENQPFILHPFQQTVPAVSNVLRCWPWKYVRCGGKKSSIKRVNFYEHLSEKKSFPTGVNVSGELYIADTLRWWRNMVVRFRYGGTTRLFPVQDVGIPYLADDNCWFVRDVKRESELLSFIRDFLDVEKSILNLPHENWNIIKEFWDKGWHLYIRKTNAPDTAVTWHKDRWGIDWLVPDSDRQDLYERDLMDAYLHGRNFVEVDGRTALFNRNSTENLHPESMAEILCPEVSVNKLYGWNTELSAKERKELLQKVNRDVSVPLFPYQSEGVIWLTGMRKRSLGCMLADDMGLGKTLQILAYLVTLGWEDGKEHLVICPASLIDNWKKEILRFTPQLQSFMTIVSYEYLKLHIEDFCTRSFDTVIVDEGQYLKNANTQRYKMLRKLSCLQMIMLSGTPIENSIDEIWAQFKLLIPEMQSLYKKLIALGVKSDLSRWIEISKKILSPFLLRRTKEEVLSNLPEKNEITILVELNGIERQMYEKIREMFVKAIDNGVSGRINSLALEGLLRLRQCCVSLNMLPRSLYSQRDNSSTKLNKVVEFIESFLREGHKMLVFSQFTSALEELGQLLQEKNIRYLLMTGSTRNRHELIDRFQHHPSDKVFLISLKTGGTGLNLTAADRVLMIDDWWNPAVENQAFSRAHRIGQHNEVMVYRFICKSTVEEKILDLHKMKKDISDMFNAAAGKFSIEQIKYLLN